MEIENQLTNQWIEGDEGPVPKGGEVSSFFPSGQIFGMDIPEGTANIVEMLVGVGAGAGAGRLGAEVTKRASKSAAKKAFTGLAKMPSRLQKLTMNKAMHQIKKTDPEKFKFLQDELKMVKDWRKGSINRAMHTLADGKPRLEFMKKVKGLEKNWHMSDFKDALKRYKKMTSNRWNMQDDYIGSIQKSADSLPNKALSQYTSVTDTHKLMPEAVGALGGALTVRGRQLNEEGISELESVSRGLKKLR